MSEERNNLPAVAVAFVAGALAGLAVGLLAAPKPGREMREDLRDFTRDLGGKVSHGADAAKASAEEWFDRAVGALSAARRAYTETRMANSTAAESHSTEPGGGL